jgi:hypothetical protein
MFASGFRKICKVSDEAVSYPQTSGDPAGSLTERKYRMDADSPITFDIGRPRLAAKALWEKGTLEITWTYDGAPDKKPSAIGRVTGYCVNSQGRDCVLFRQIDKTGQWVMRSIPFNQMTYIRRASLNEVLGAPERKVSPR